MGQLPFKRDHTRGQRLDNSTQYTLQRTEHNEHCMVLPFKARTNKLQLLDLPSSRPLSLDKLRNVFSVLDGSSRPQQVVQLRQ